uniref:Phytosulfokine receptor 1 n=1 Tax=Anthurium amnicola TaxID=1678845 RepID=A0A1D1ZHT7_9ARAE
MILRRGALKGMKRVQPVLTVNCSSVGFFLCFFCSFHSSSSSSPPVSGSRVLTCNSKDRDALVGFSKGLDSGVPGWPRNASSNCCRWPGVHCATAAASSSRNTSVRGSRVVGLELGRKGLKGALRGEPLLGLDELTTLNLSQNSLVGVVPVQLLQLRQLEVLDLSKNFFFGAVSGDIGNLSALRHLDISFNSFSGPVPASLSSCSMLASLDLRGNSLSGGIPADLFRLRQLGVLYLSGNNFTGELSDGVGNLSALRHLEISFNNFSGPIPDAFRGLRELRTFAARHNGFTGGLPASLSSCSTLTSLDLGENSLSEEIRLFDFTGLVRLRTLRLDSNRFVGRIPGNLSSCTGLEWLTLAKSGLHGEIPSSFRDLRALSILSLSNASNVSGALAILSECRNLTVLVLRSSFLNESMPSDGIRGFERLKALAVANCGLSGSIPSWLKACAGLRLLDLSSNRLGGEVPPWLGNLVHLFYLDLSNNLLGGGLPNALARLYCPTSRNCTQADVSSLLEWRQNRGGLVVEYTRFSSVLPTLDLSNNMMNGPILTGFGDLTQLSVLDLSNNNFSGPIPEQLSNMSRLEFLDLSHNNLSGSIPDSLVRLTFLSGFSVAYNHLRGRVPTGGQFATFPCSSFEGNSDQWGEPLLSMYCPVVTPSVNGTEMEGFKITFMPLPYGIGVVIGFIPTVVICRFYPRCLRRKKEDRRE